MTTLTFRIPTTDLCADLRVQPDPELDDTGNVCVAQNRHLRLYVAAWMLSKPDLSDYAESLERALALYEGSGTLLLEAPGRLTTASIAAEVMRLIPPDPEEDGR